MKILQVGLSYNHGGIESCIMNYYREFVGRGVQFDFISIHSTLACEDEIKKLGGKIFYIPNMKQHPIKYKKAMEKIILQGNYDVIYVNMLSAANILPLSVANKCGCKKIVAHSHNNDTPGIHRKILHRLNKRKVGRYATDLVACSKSAAQFMFGDKLCGEAKIVNNGISVERFLFSEEKRRKIQNELGLSDKNMVVGHVGRFQYQKNQTFLVDIFYELQKKKPEAKLILVGDGPGRGSIQEKVDSLKISDKVVFLGERQDVEEILCAMDVMVIPSRFEGLGMVVIEAQCAGLPVVCSDVLVDETKVLEQYEKVSLSQTPETWAEIVLKWYKGPNRAEDNYLVRKQMEEKGYDIKKESEKLWEILKR